MNGNNRVLNNVLEAIGNMPLIRLNRLNQSCSANILVKLGYTNAPEQWARVAKHQLVIIE